MRDVCARIARVQPMMYEDGPWWPLQEICEALRAPCMYHYRAAYRLTDAGDKRTVAIDTGKRCKRRITLVNRAGVERLVIRYSGTVPRGEVMAALDDAKL